MSSFTSPLSVTPLDDGRTWVLNRPFTYHIGSRYSRNKITIPKDFPTDFASIPKFIFWVLPWWAKFNKPSPLHDFLYQIKQIMGKPIIRKRADDVFLEAMFIDFRKHKLGKIIAHIEYLAVRLFGWLAWHRQG